MILDVLEEEEVKEKKTWNREIMYLLLFVIISQFIVIVYSKDSERKALYENSVLREAVTKAWEERFAKEEWKPVSEAPEKISEKGYTEGCWKFFDGQYYYTEENLPCEDKKEGELINEP